MKTLAAKVGNSGARSGNRRVWRRQRNLLNTSVPRQRPGQLLRAGGGGLHAPPSDATIITVTDPAGSGGSSGDVTLSYAVAEADAATGNYVITFAPAAESIAVFQRLGLFRCRHERVDRWAGEH